MPKQFFRRISPKASDIRNNRYLQFLGSALHNSSLWHLNRRSVAGAFAIGLFCAFLPFPFQTAIVALLAVLIRVNLPLSVALVFVTNPITIPPMFYGAYVLGAWLMDVPTGNFAFELSFAWLTNGLLQIWQPFLLGCLVSGFLAGSLGYISIRLLWRWMIVRKLAERKKRTYCSRKPKVPLKKKQSSKPNHTQNSVKRTESKASRKLKKATEKVKKATLIKPPSQIPSP